MITLKELQKRVKVPNTTLRDWINQFNIPIERGSRNKILIPGDSIPVFKKIKSLKAQGLEPAGIMRKISGDHATIDPPAGDNQAIDAEFSEVATPQMDLQRAVQLAVVEHSNLGENLLKAGRELGFLQAENGQLKDQLASLPQLREEITAARSLCRDLELAGADQTREFDRLTADHSRQVAELELAHKKNAQLSEDNQALKKELEHIKKSVWFKFIR